MVLAGWHEKSVFGEDCPCRVVAGKRILVPCAEYQDAVAFSALHATPVSGHASRQTGVWTGPWDDR